MEKTIIVLMSIRTYITIREDKSIDRSEKLDALNVAIEILRNKQIKGN